MPGLKPSVPSRFQRMPEEESRPSLPLRQHSPANDRQGRECASGKNRVSRLAVFQGKEKKISHSLLQGSPPPLSLFMPLCVASR